MFRFAVFVLCSLFAFNKAQAQFDKLLIVSDLNEINSSESASIKEERAIALAFHQLINDYRISNKLKTILWDDTLWLVARNHNLWMSKTQKLSHLQNVNNDFFTGKEPEERLRFVNKQIIYNNWNGENCLYFDGFTSPIQISHENAAKDIFELWRNSAGHNNNMLKASHQSHGLSVYIDNGGRLWATDLFGIQWLDNSASNNKLAYAINGKPSKLNKDASIPLNIIKLLYSNEGIYKIPTNDIWHEEARAVLQNIKLPENDSIIQFEYQKRIEKPLFPLFKKQHANCYIYYKKLSEYNIDVVAKLFQPNLFEKVGYASRLFNSKGDKYIIIARISAIN